MFMQAQKSFTLIQGGIVMLRLQSTCWLSSYLVDLRRKDRSPAGSLLLSLTLRHAGTGKAMKTHIVQAD